MAARLELEVEACYCSILGECWKSDLRGLEPARVDECVAGPDDYVEFGAGIDEKSVLPMLKKEE